MFNVRISLTAAAIACAVSTTAAAGPLPILPWQTAEPQVPQATAYAPVEAEDTAELPSKFKRQVVNYATHEATGTIVIDTPNTFLYLVLGNGRALRYGIGVGREGFTWAGTKTVEKKAEWPDWHPPQEMIARQPICRASWPAAPVTRWAPAPCTCPARSIASTAPTRRRPSASMCHRAASG
jgi:lipoprotein-anchoring transpeptidase ErfK/SrfK